MIQYLIINLVISIIALALVQRMKEAPAGVKLSIVLFTLCLWLIPVHHLEIRVPISKQSPVSAYFQVLEMVDLADDASFPIQLTSSESKPWWIGLILLVALAKWMFGWQKIKKQLSEMALGSYLVAVDDLGLVQELPDDLTRRATIRLIPESYDACAVGYFKPEIWMGTKHLGTAQVPSLILHEWTHIVHGDNFLRFFLHGMDCLFWWNPLVGYITAQARLYSEMRCDRHCQNQDSEYASNLAKALVLEHKKPVFASGMANHFFHNKKTNIRRIKELERRKTMLKISHVIFVCLSLSLSVMLFARADEVISTKKVTEKVATIGQEGVTPPEFTKKVPPVYPDQAKKDQVGGFVLVKAIFGKDGVVRDLEIVKGLKDKKYGFEEAAMDAIKQWEYSPGTVDGKPVDVELTLKIDFKLR